MRVHWDWLKYNVRNKTIQYSKTKAKQCKERIISIEEQLKLAEEEQTETQTIENLNKLENLKRECEKEYEYITKGVIVHFLVNWYENGEKNNNNFLNFENNNKTKSAIRKLNLKDSNIAINPKVIMDELHSFCSDLYNDKNEGKVTDQSCTILETENIPKLSSVMQELSEGELSYYLIFKTITPLGMTDLLLTSKGLSGSSLVICW